MFRIVTIAALLLAGVTTASADVYRWTDADGRVHYSDRWVPGSERVKTGAVRPPNPEADEQRAAAERDKLATSNDRISQQQSQQSTERAVQQDVAKAREQQCKEATERYQKAIQARRVYKTGPNGEREYVSDSEADAWRLRTRTEMEAACGS